MNVVVVESPAKAKTINKYLGKDYVVLASYGHVRDLPSKNGSVDPDNDFEMTYETDPRSAGHLKDIAKALKGSSGSISQPIRIARAKQLPGTSWAHCPR